MAADAPDWERVVVVISGGGVSDAPDWQRTVTGPGGSSVGGYASLTGAGETSTPGELDQAGPFQVVNTVGAPGIDLVDISTAGISLTCLGAGKLLLTAGGGGGFAATDNGSGGDMSIEASTGDIVLIGGAGVNLQVLPTGLELNYPLSFGSGTPAVSGVPTVSGSKAGNAALASLLTALATFGLVVDATT